MKSDFKEMEAEMDLLAGNMESIASFSEQVSLTLQVTKLWFIPTNRSSVWHNKNPRPKICICNLIKLTFANIFLKSCKQWFII